MNESTDMANLAGVVRLHRRLRRHRFWKREPFTYGQAWVDLILLAVNAEMAPQTIDVHGQPVTLERGQVGWSELALAAEWKRSREWVRAFLRAAQEAGMVTVEANRRTGTIITILNYDAYQLDQTSEQTTGETTDQTSEQTTGETTDQTTDQTYRGKGEGGSGKREGGRRVVPPAGGPAPMVGDEAGPSGTGEGATVIPTDDEVRAFAAEYRDLARGCEAGIPEGWWRDWLAWMLRDLKRRPWPADWQRIMVNRFTSDLVSRHPKALGLSGEPGEARGAGGISKKIAAGSMARPDGRTVAQARFQLDRELAQVRERLDAAHEVNLPPDAADKRRERELRAAIAELEAQ